MKNVSNDMRNSTLGPSFVLFFTILSIAGCPGSAGDTDAGSSVDGGANMTADAGEMHDAGASMPMDAGTEVDAGFGLNDAGLAGDFHLTNVERCIKTNEAVAATYEACGGTWFGLDCEPFEGNIDDCTGLWAYYTDATCVDGSVVFPDEIGTCE